MQDFQFFLTDDRYSVPSLTFVSAQDALAARADARRLLAESAHHRAIEVRDGDTLLYTVRPARSSARPVAAPSRVRS